MDTKDWNLLNAAQAIIPQLSQAQRRAMAASDDGWVACHKGKIASPGNPTALRLFRLGLIQTNATLTYPTTLGTAVRNVLRNRLPGPL